MYVIYSYASGWWFYTVVFCVPYWNVCCSCYEFGFNEPRYDVALACNVWNRYTVSVSIWSLVDRWLLYLCKCMFFALVCCVTFAFSARIRTICLNRLGLDVVQCKFSIKKIFQINLLIFDFLFFCSRCTVGLLCTLSTKNLRSYSRPTLNYSIHRVLFYFILYCCNAVHNLYLLFLIK